MFRVRQGIDIAQRRCCLERMRAKSCFCQESGQQIVRKLGAILGPRSLPPKEVLELTSPAGQSGELRARKLRLKLAGDFTLNLFLLALATTLALI